MTTYYVTKEQLDLLEKAKESDYVLTSIYGNYSEKFREQFNSMVLGKETIELQKAALRYIGGDVYIKFKVKEKMYLLHGTDKLERDVYMTFSKVGKTPDWTFHRHEAYIVPLEVIEQYQTPFWTIQEVTDEI